MKIESSALALGAQTTTWERLCSYPEPSKPDDEKRASSSGFVSRVNYVTFMTTDYSTVGTLVMTSISFTEAIGSKVSEDLKNTQETHSGTLDYECYSTNKVRAVDYYKIRVKKVVVYVECERYRQERSS